MVTIKSAVVKNARGLDDINCAYPVAVKLLSKDASHKTDVGGVKLNCRTAQEAVEAIHAINKSASAQGRGLSVDGFIIQEMAPKGEEFFIGGRRDASFGPIIMAGLGGVFIELFKDRAIRLAPITESDALDMLNQLKAFPLLAGYRGRPALDIMALVECICRVSNLLVQAEYINEIDLNPIIIHPAGQGVSIVDSRVFFR
jgi:succinyl-CoA synthetase beta subunit